MGTEYSAEPGNNTSWVIGRGTATSRIIFQNLTRKLWHAVRISRIVYGAKGLLVETSRPIVENRTALKP